MADASELSGQISLVAGVLRGRLLRALDLDLSEDVREILENVQDGLDTILELTAAAAPGEGAEEA
jgi:hypothetical protein